VGLDQPDACRSTLFWRSSGCSEYYAPKNFNFWYFFGSLALLVLVMQLRDRHIS
jgi:hypothetical protein